MADSMMMRSLPSVAPFAALLTDLADALRRGCCCLVIADKGWTHLLFYDLQKRLKEFGVRCMYMDGRPAPGANHPDEVGVMLTAISQLRQAVRQSVGGVVGLPHLDVMTPSDSGWTNIAREVVPLLYEAPETVFLGFCDPTLQLLPVVEKLFSRRYVMAQPFRESLESGPVVAAEGRSPSELTVERRQALEADTGTTGQP